MSRAGLGDVIRGVSSPSFDTEFRASQALSVAAVDEAPGLAERLKAVRRWLGLSQGDVARELGIRRYKLALIEVDHVAAAGLRAKVRAWLEPREAAIAAEDARAERAGRESGPAEAGPEGRTPRKDGAGPSPAGRTLAPAMMAGLVLRRRIERRRRKAEAAWRKRHARRRRPSALGLLLRGAGRSPSP